MIDEWVRSRSKKEFDRDGLIAKSGKIMKIILKKFLSDSYNKKKFPKSLDVKDFNLQNLNKIKFRRWLCYFVDVNSNYFYLYIGN